MNIEVTGRLTGKSETETFGNFRKRTFVVTEDDGQYQNPFEFELVQDGVDMISSYQKDTMLTVKGFVVCREGKDKWEGKYFTSLRATSIQTAHPNQSKPQPQQQPEQQESQAYAQDDIPF